MLREFQRVVRSGDVAGFRQMVAQHPALRGRLDDPLFDFDSPAIRQAVERKDLAMVDALLEAGADINRRSQWEPGGFGVLDRADDELAAQLIVRGAVVDIHAAAHLGKLDRLRELLDADPGLVNARGGDGGTPLHFARDLATAEVLLQRGADVRIRDLDHGSTAAMWQVRNRDVLYRLIAAGSPIDIYMACVHGDLPLAERALREDPDCLSAYISHDRGQGKFAPDTGGNIYNWQIGHAARPIPVAAEFHHPALVGYLLPKAKPIDRLIARCFIGDGSAKALVSSSPALFADLDPAARRALPDAIHFRKLAAAEAMIGLGFPLDGHGVMRGSPLHVAAWHGDRDLTMQLLAAGASVNDTDNDQNSTPLEWACHGSQHSWSTGGDYGGVAGALVQAGADLGRFAAVLRSGETDWAAPEVIKVLTPR